MTEIIHHGLNIKTIEDIPRALEFFFWIIATDYAALGQSYDLMRSANETIEAFRKLGSTIEFRPLKKQIETFLRDFEINKKDHEDLWVDLMKDIKNLKQKIRLTDFEETKRKELAKHEKKIRKSIKENKKRALDILSRNEIVKNLSQDDIKTLKEICDLTFEKLTNYWKLSNFLLNEEEKDKMSKMMDEERKRHGITTQEDQNNFMKSILEQTKKKLKIIKDEDNKDE